jgi:O-antigen ligase
MNLTFQNIKSFLKDDRTQSIAFCFFAFTFGLGTFINSIGLIVFLLSTVFRILLSEERALHNYKALLFSIPFLLYLICYPYAYDIEDATTFIIKSLPILIIPLILAKTHLSTKLVDKVKDYFIKGMALSIVIAIIGSSISFVNNGYEISYLNYYDLAQTLSFHPTYYSMYLITACVFTTERQRFSSDKRAPLFLFFFLIGIVLLQTRAAYLIIFALFIIRLFQVNNLKYKLTFLFIFFFMLLLVFFIPGNSERFKEAIRVNNSQLIGDNTENGITQRIWLWNIALSHVKEQPFFGHGLRSQRSYFKKRVHKDMLKSNISNSQTAAYIGNASKNLHNQYLQILYDCGAFGLLIFLLGIYFLFKNSILVPSNSFVILFIFYLVFLLSENILDRQHGIYFYSFIFPILFLNQGPFKDKNGKSNY